MKIALLLHIYQPSTQYPSIVSQAVKESYEPLIEVFEQSPNGKVTLNINAALTEQISQLGHSDVLQRINSLAEKRKIELTGSAKYHALLTTLPSHEINRQIELNDKTNRQLIGEAYQPEGFYPPEMMYSVSVGETLAEIGYKWVVIDESAHPETAHISHGEKGDVMSTLGKVFFRQKGTKLNMVIRDRDVSGKVAFSRDITVDSLNEFINEHYPEGAEYIVLALDGETFGFHKKHNFPFLVEFLNNDKWELVTISELLQLKLPTIDLEPLDSTWGVIQENELHERLFPRWISPDNPLHNIQWDLLNLALNTVSPDGISRMLLDQGLQSDQFWWAANDPCWHPEMVEKGGALLRDAIIQSTEASSEDKNRALQLYKTLVKTGVALYGSETRFC